MKVAVAMSGGMDSTATALLLKRQGHEVKGLHMSLHSHSDTTWQRAKSGAEQVGVPIERVDLAEDFCELVVRRFVQEYSRGRTPSPCPICNRFIKMTRLLEKAVSLGCEKLATGHYARIEAGPDGPVLLRGVDRRKDQSYFLFMVTPEMLDRIIFPLGGRTKTGVKELLKEEGISLWQSDESQELCFVPDNDYRRFLESKGIESRPGPIMDLQGNILGVHRGIIGFTVGQRRGLGISGRKPLYVVRIDPATDAVFVGVREETYVSSTTITRVHFLVPSLPATGERFKVKVRSTARPVDCVIATFADDTLRLRYDEPQAGVAPGQAAVLYRGERVIGGGWIEESA